MLYAALRETHTILAYLLFVMFVAHLGAILFHTLIVRDGILNRMVPWKEKISMRPAEPDRTEA
jgi:cytochrome b561